MSIFTEIDTAYRRTKAHQAAAELYLAADDMDISDERNNERSLFHLAAEYGDADAISILLDGGANPNVQDTMGETPLHALAKGNTDLPVNDEAAEQITLRLLEARVSAMRKDSMGNTCYHIAAMEGCYPLVRVLAARGTRIAAINSYGKNILHLAAYYSGLNKRNLDRHQTRIDEVRALYAGKRTEEEIEGDIEWDIGAVKRYSALDKAYLNIIRLGLEAGIDPDDKDEADKTPLDYAVEANYGKLTLLLKGELDDEDSEEQDAKIAAAGKNLHQAVRNHDVAAVEALLKLGADVDEVLDEVPFNQQTPLIVACIGLMPDLVEFLLNNKADACLKAGPLARTAMFWLLRYSAPKEEDLKQKKVQQIIQLLLKAGVGIDDTVDDAGNTALNIICMPPANIFNAMRYGNNSLQASGIEALVAAGANLDAPNFVGLTPLMHLCLDEGDLLENQLITLLEGGADLDMKDRYGNTAFMAACANRNKAAAKTAAELMLDFGKIDINAVNDEGLTAMDYAVKNNNEPLVKLLLEQA